MTGRIVIIPFLQGKEEGHRILRSQVEPEDLVREDTRNLTMFEWARELLLEDGE